MNVIAVLQKHKITLIFIVIIAVLVIYSFNTPQRQIVSTTNDFDIVNVTSQNDHYGFWKSTDAYTNHRNLSASHIRQYQAEYLHKTKPVVYKYKNTYTCVGFGLANSVFIVTDNCVVVNDVGTDTVQGDKMVSVIQSVTNLPVKYVIFGHNHIDHVGGIGSYLRVWPDLKIIAHKNIHYNVNNTSTVISKILGVRSGKHAGINVPDDLFDHAGIGPHKEVNTAHSTYRDPDIVLNDETKEMELCGDKFIFMWAPSETDDELCVYYPKNRVIMTNEIINPSAPSSYTLRGTKRRDIKVWINTLNNMLTEFSGAEFMAPTHGRPVVGNANVIRRISEYKKGTEEMYDQTMALMNEGMLPDEIEHKVKVSDELNVPWNYYDHYNYQASFPRAIYQNYLGHYNGDPYTLIINQESHPADRACYYADDNKRTFRKVEQLVRDGELAFASELLTYIIRCPSTTDVNREKAKLLKSDLYMKLAEDQTSSNLRNWLISDAQILQGKENKLDINFAVKRV